MSAESSAGRLALLSGLTLPETDLEEIAKTFEDYDRALLELRPFAERVTWPSIQMQPRPSEVDRGRP